MGDGRREAARVRGGSALGAVRRGGPPRRTGVEGGGWPRSAAALASGFSLALPGRVILDWAAALRARSWGGRGGRWLACWIRGAGVAGSRRCRLRRSFGSPLTRRGGGLGF